MVDKWIESVWAANIRKQYIIWLLKIKLKDTTTPIYYEDVLSHFLEGPTLALLFKDNVVRNFPLTHIWYYETQQDRIRTKTPSETTSKL